jgi:transcriptional regulator with XRE-family HTH domain
LRTCLSDGCGTPVLAPYRGVPYRLDLERCRRVLEELRIEGEVEGTKGFAAKIGISHSTVCRLFSGRLPSMEVILKILDGLHLAVEEVATRDDDQEGTAGVGARV